MWKTNMALISPELPAHCKICPSMCTVPVRVRLPKQIYWSVLGFCLGKLPRLSCPSEPSCLAFYLRLEEPQHSFSLLTSFFLLWFHMSGNLRNRVSLYDFIASLQSELPNRGTLTFGVGAFCCRGHPVHQRMFGSSFGSNHWVPVAPSPKWWWSKMTHDAAHRL